MLRVDPWVQGSVTWTGYGRFGLLGSAGVCADFSPRHARLSDWTFVVAGKERKEKEEKGSGKLLQK